MRSEVLDDLAAVRDSRHTAALVKYRKMISEIASGEAMPAKFGDSLDRIMIRLEIVDDNIATDVAAERLHQQARSTIEEVESDRAAIEQRVAEAGAAMEALREEQKSFETRRLQVEHAVHLARVPLGAAHSARQRITKLERENPRLYGVLSDA